MIYAAVKASLWQCVKSGWSKFSSCDLQCNERKQHLPDNAIMIWQRFPYYWPWVGGWGGGVGVVVVGGWGVGGIRRCPVDGSYKGWVTKSLCVWNSFWSNSWVVCDLWCHEGHVITLYYIGIGFTEIQECMPWVSMRAKWGVWCELNDLCFCIFHCHGCAI